MEFLRVSDDPLWSSPQVNKLWFVQISGAYSCIKLWFAAYIN